MATHSSILAWEIPWREGACQATVHGVAKESDMTQLLNNNSNVNTQVLSCKLQCLFLFKIIIFIVLCSQTQSRITKYLSKASHMKKRV